MALFDHVWSLNRTRRHLNSSQAALADARRNRMTDAYASVRAAAKERQGTRNDLHRNIVEQIPQSEPTPSAPQTRDMRAAAAGASGATEAIDLALTVGRPHCRLRGMVTQKQSE